MDNRGIVQYDRQGAVLAASPSLQGPSLQDRQQWWAIAQRV
ncbi:MAG: hypothetical protein ACFB0G_12185 [Leptolyngbyaceae cyanobacterium]